MATSYTSNKKIGALDSASTPLAATNEIVINQNGDILKTPLSAVEAKVFDAKTAVTNPSGTEVVVVRQTDNTLRQVALSDIVPAGNITNAKVSASAAIEDTKLATINTAGKVTNNAVQATSALVGGAYDNGVGASKIVARDGSGNFAAGTITATLSGNASTATNLSSNRTFALTGDVTGSVSSNLSSGASIATAIGSGVIVNADVNNNAEIAHSKLANIPAGQVLLGNASNVPTATAVTGDVTINSSGVTTISSGIAGTKIAPDFGSQNVVTTGQIISGPTNSFSGTGGVLANFTAQSSNPRIGLYSFSTVPSFQARVELGRTRGAPGQYNLVQNEDSLGSVMFTGGAGGQLLVAADIRGVVDGTPGSSDMPGRLVFSTTADGASSVTERMRITAAGNVGIANAAPTEKLHVTGNIKLSGYVDADTSFRGQASDSAAAPSFTWTGDTNTGMFRPAADTLAFCEGGVEAMRISDNGSILIGTTTPIDPAQGSDDGATFWQGISLRISSTGNCILLRKRSTNGNIMSFTRDTTTVGTISVTTTATAYNTSSDYRLKENPTPLIGGLATINQLQPCEFTWKSDGSVGRGFIAHELQAVVPEAVTGEKDAVDAEGNPQYQGVDAAKLVPYLVSAVQELKARVEALEAA